jgi:cytochrome c553
MASLSCAARLELAEDALHDLLTGKKTVSVAYGERRVQYSESNIAELRKYVQELRAECGTSTQQEDSRRRPLRPIY